MLKQTKGTALTVTDDEMLLDGKALAAQEGFSLRRKGRQP